MPLHPLAWRRQFTLPALITLVLTAVVTWRQGPWGLAVLAALPLLLVQGGPALAAQRVTVQSAKRAT